MHGRAEKPLTHRLCVTGDYSCLNNNPLFRARVPPARGWQGPWLFCVFNPTFGGFSCLLLHVLRILCCSLTTLRPLLPLPQGLCTCGPCFSLGGSTSRDLCDPTPTPMDISGFCSVASLSPPLPLLGSAGEGIQDLTNARQVVSLSYSTLRWGCF